MEGIRRTDRFITYTKSNVSALDNQALSLFYQPIIGCQAFVLYMTLVSLLDRQNLTSIEYLHGDLESLLNCKLEIIEKNRYKLEAIGLLNTFYLNDHFIYEIKQPLSAQSFVNDGVLGQYLISAITSERFKKLIEIFKIKAPNKKQYFKLTKSFDEVFPAITYGSSLNESALMSAKKADSVQVNLIDFDWRLFTESISPTYYDIANLTDVIKDKISNLSYVYDLDEMEMREVFIKAVDKKIVNINRLAIEAREQFKFASHKENKIIEHAKEPIIRNIPKDPVEYFKVMTPKAILYELGGGMVSSADLRIVERLIEDIGLDKGVVNVLLAYIAKISNGTLPGYEYFEKVGLSWKRNQITSVELAMNYVHHLNSEYEKKKNGEPTSSNTKKYTKNNRPDIEVDWLDDYMKTLK